MYKQISLGSKHLILWHSQLGVCIKENNHYGQFRWRFWYRNQHSLVRMKFHFPWVNIRLWEYIINNNYYFYVHYLANIALNLEACFNSGANFTIYLQLVLQKWRVFTTIQFSAVLAQTNTARCVQCSVNTSNVKSASRKINKKTEYNNIKNYLGSRNSKLQKASIWNMTIF